ncbi:unnamed protein product [Brassica napus]|uniref:(rape) hypothetical protein n=1 Tax=Brassica napus TaxID=3708 RepID=A0A816VUM2_BRANA|nr:unnamed protein product [Brassica napus]
MQLSVDHHKAYSILCELTRCNAIFNFRASFLTNHVTLTWRNLTDSADSSNPCLSSSLRFKASQYYLEKRKPLLIFLQDSAVNLAESIVEMESSKVHEAGKVEETHQKVDPESEESKEDPNATRVLALDMILKSLLKISVFLSDFLLEFCQETHHSLTEDGEYALPPSTQLRDFLLSNLNVTHPLEANGVFDFLVTILEVLPLWRNVEEPLSSKFEVYHQVAKKICNRCKLVTEYPSAFKDFAFENILKVTRIALMMMPCDKEGCGKQNYVERVISKLPSVFTIAVEWEKNETEEDIFATTSVLATEIDISEIFKYEGDSLFTKYRLVSMVCCHGDQYSCIAYENRSWVIHFGSQNEVSGDWNRVLSIFAKLKIRPEILLFENVMGRDQIVSRN